MAANIVDWERMAAYWDEKHGDDGDLWHCALIDPTLLRTMRPVAGLRVLDLACGNGYLSRKLARLGTRVTAIDASAPIIALAGDRENRQPFGIIYHVADAARLDMLADGAINLVVCNMGLMDFSDAEGAVHEVARVLAP